jgi:hypothetical protein
MVNMSGMVDKHLLTLKRVSYFRILKISHCYHLLRGMMTCHHSRDILTFCMVDLSCLQRCTVCTIWELSIEILSPRMCCKRGGLIFSRSLTLASQMLNIHVQAGGSVVS